MSHKNKVLAFFVFCIIVCVCCYGINVVPIKKADGVNQEIYMRLGKPEKFKIFKELKIDSEETGYIISGFTFGESSLGCAVLKENDNYIELISVFTSDKMAKRGKDSYSKIIYLGTRSYYIFLSNNPELKKIEWILQNQKMQYFEVNEAPSITLISCPPKSFQVKYRLLDEFWEEV